MQEYMENTSETSRKFLEDIKKLCVGEISSECIETIDLFLETTKENIFSRKKIRSESGRREWIEKIISRGLRDGRKRFILKVLSPYLINVLKLSDEEAFERIREFIDNSCRNYGNCEKIYESWIKGDLRRVRSKGIKPAKLERLDEELREIIRETLSS
ncbi:MAG: DNA primase noncatalytic subunit PriX [Sulfolobales archaeon]